MNRIDNFGSDLYHRLNEEGNWLHQLFHDASLDASSCYDQGDAKGQLDNALLMCRINDRISRINAVCRERYWKTR